MEDKGATAKTGSVGAIIIVLGLLAAFAPMATDMYLSGFHVMSEHFGVSEGGMELTLSIFFLGLAAGQAIYGPLIDRFGRRGPLLAGIFLYLIATIGCLLAPSIEIFIALRFLQAVGGSAGMITGRAIIRDLFDAREGARALSLMMMVMTIAPIVAPILGGLIVTYMNWQTIFYVMLGFGMICITLVWLLVPETLPPERRIASSLLGIARIWGGMMADRRFAIPAIAGGLGQASMFAFITGSPFVFINVHGASSQTYGLLFALVACALIVSAQVNRVALRYKTPEFILSVALVLNVVAGLLCVASVGTDSLVALLVPLWFAVGSLGFIGANAAAVAMEASGRNAGSGSSLIGVLQFGLAFIVSGLVASSQNGTAYPMTVAILCCGLGSSLLWFVARSRRAG